MASEQYSKSSNEKLSIPVVLHFLATTQHQNIVLLFLNMSFSSVKCKSSLTTMNAKREVQVCLCIPPSLLKQEKTTLFGSYMHLGSSGQRPYKFLVVQTLSTYNFSKIVAFLFSRMLFGV